MGDVRTDFTHISTLFRKELHVVVTIEQLYPTFGLSCLKRTIYTKTLSENDWFDLHLIEYDKKVALFRLLLLFDAHFSLFL